MRIVVNQTLTGIIDNMGKSTPAGILINQPTSKAILDIAQKLTTGLSKKVRCDHVVTSIRKALQCDAVVLMSFDGEELTPISADGLSADILGRRFKPAEHPRLQTILEASFPLRFAADDPSPDPYYGLIASDTVGDPPTRACMGAPLYVKDYVAGILTFCAAKPQTFDQLDDWTLATFVALAAGALRITRLIDILREQAEQRGMVTRDLVFEALHRGGDLMGESPVMRQLSEEVDIVAHSDLSVLICGETGTGKEVVARAIHANSPRNDYPLVYVNCAALPEQIAESELFGHVKGAFTGATKDRSGKFELANKGTLLLDEVGELPLQLQAKLLRAIQFGEIQRVGSDKNTSVDVRIIASTNRNLEEEVAAGNFRADLFHRLNVYPILVPKLKDRGDDIALLTGRFLDQARVRLGCKEIRITPQALVALANYHWPGNVRELEHVIMRAALRAASESHDAVVIVEEPNLDIDDKPTAGKLPDTQANELPEGSFTEIVDQFQAQLILNAVENCNGNWSQAAKRLQLDRSNMHRLAKRLGIKSQSGAKS